MKTFFSPRYTVEMGDHVFPTMKFGLVAKKLLSDNTLRPGWIVEPEPAAREELLLAHSTRWVDKMLMGTASKADLALLELPWSMQLLDAHLRAVRGTIGACREALNAGLGLHIGGGSHHAMPDHGEGFCMFNDIAIGILFMMKEAGLERALVVDLDVHHGNGTAAIFAKKPEVFTFSMHQEANYPAEKPPSSLDIGLADGTEDEVYLTRLRQALPVILEQHRPQLVVYQAGADLYEKDLLGGLDITRAGILERDKAVFEACFKLRVPVAVTLGGGYAAKLEDTVLIHAATLKAGIDMRKKLWTSASTR